ncbi:hypothetical protein [Endozoicomonas sp. ONNA1]|uniref:hypothetical protein n=1 Tax=Endozoicomonas sp. ONNA1 TaxID=2828740 RepID=UPI0021492A0C|nr:hypothetical protein [Endozoicomonas sp. ONNA1]
MEPLNNNVPDSIAVNPADHLMSVFYSDLVIELDKKRPFQSVVSHLSLRHNVKVVLALKQRFLLTPYNLILYRQSRPQHICDCIGDIKTFDHYYIAPIHQEGEVTLFVLDKHKAHKGTYT